MPSVKKSQYFICPSSARRITKRSIRVNAVAACLLALIGRASAHPEFNAVTTNRYLKLDLLSGSEVRLVYTVMYGAGPALAERQRADTNSDGQLDENETRALGERLKRDVAAHLQLSVDGQKWAPAFEPAAVGLAGNEVGPGPFSVDLSARIPCPGAGAHALVLDDQTELPQLGESELRVEESPATRLLESHRGGGAGPRESRIVFRGPKFSALEDRTITVRFEGTGRVPVAHSDGKPAAQVALAVIVLLAVGGLLLVALRKRQRNMNG
jgi:hypothetical protein